jgi:hypothetical protein
MVMVIYKTTNLINGKIYIGQDTKDNPEYIGSGLLLERAVKKYGKKNFKKEILEVCRTQKDLDDKEIFWIAKLNSVDKKIGYNISPGGQGGIVCDIEILSGKNNYINKMSPEERERHLNTFRRGINYWKSRGFTTIIEIENWIKENWCGENHSHKKGKTEEEYKQWLKSTQIGANFRTKEWRESLKGKNNPIFRGKTETEIQQWLDQHRRGKNAPNAKYFYRIEKPDGTVIETECLKTTCQEENFNLHVLRKFIEMSLGKRNKFVPRLKKYLGWKVYRIKKERKNV